MANGLRVTGMRAASCSRCGGSGVKFLLWVLVAFSASGARADVINRTSSFIYLQPEAPGALIALPPGGSFYGDQDAVLIPDPYGVRVFKTVDRTHALVNTSAGVRSFGGNPVERLGQRLFGGWLTAEKRWGYRWARRLVRVYRELVT